MDFKPKLELSLDKKKGTGKKILIGAGIVIALLLACYSLTAQLVFAERFIPGTIIDGINCGFSGTDKAKAALEQEIKGYSLKITDGKTTDTLTAEEIDLTGDFDNELSAALQSQKRLMWGIGLFRAIDIKTAPAVEYNTDKLNQRIGELTLVSGSQVTDSANAYLRLNDSERYEVVPEVYGTRLDRERFGERINTAINGLEKSIDLTQEDFYIKPEVYKDNEAMINAMDTVNRWLSSVITYKFGSKSETADCSVTKDWIVISEDYSAYFDRDKVKEFVRGLSKKYDTFGDTRSFPTSYGFSVNVAGGNYGYRINREAEIDGLVADIKSGEKKERKPEYYQEGVSYDGPDIGNTYVEIDLTGQHLFLYKDGNMVLHTEIVSGHPTKSGGTPNGTYRITYCQRNATLRGDNYETPVAYWMPFNGDIGLHDATWQPKFGGDWYVRHGSHGCINLPLNMAAQIYSYAYKGMPVVCYRYSAANYNAVDSYRASKGLGSIFDTQPEPTTAAATEAATAAAATETTTAAA